MGDGSLGRAAPLLSLVPPAAGWTPRWGQVTNTARLVGPHTALPYRQDEDDVTSEHKFRVRPHFVCHPERPCLQTSWLSGHRRRDTWERDPAFPPPVPRERVLHEWLVPSPTSHGGCRTQRGGCRRSGQTLLPVPATGCHRLDLGLPQRDPRYEGRRREKR